MTPMVKCSCPSRRHQIVITEDVFLCQPDTCQEYTKVIYCASGDRSGEDCPRMSCVASEPGYGAHCCKQCGDTKGLEHSAACDLNWAWMRLRIRVKVSQERPTLSPEPTKTSTVLTP